jgi:hypothetical protein
MQDESKLKSPERSLFQCDFDSLHVLFPMETHKHPKMLFLGQGCYCFYAAFLFTLALDKKKNEECSMWKGLLLNHGRAPSK